VSFHIPFSSIEEEVKKLKSKKNTTIIDGVVSVGERWEGVLVSLKQQGISFPLSLYFTSIIVGKIISILSFFKTAALN